VLIDKRADTQASGYSRDYTRYYLPPDTVSAGAIVKAHAEELHADGVAGTPA
jgi:hypothetical protein